MKRLFLSLIVAGGAASSLFAANIASDDSSDAAYSDAYPQWDSGDNGGFGFGAWTLDPASNAGNAGFFTATAAQNGNFPSGGAIDVGGDSWGIYANQNGGPATAVAYRGLTGGSLGVGDKFTISMDNGYVDGGGGIVGFVLRNGNNTGNKNANQRFEFLFIGGGIGNYQIVDNSGLVDTGIGYTEGGLTMEFTLTGTDTYLAKVTRLSDSSTANISGTLSGTSGWGIDSVALYNQYAGDGQNYDLFFNSMSVVPEPGVAGLVSLATITLWRIRRRS